MTPPSPEFVEQFTRDQRRLYLYILSQVPSTHDAEEVLQQTNLIIWAKYDQFDVTTSFFAWSSRIATYEILKFRQRFAREKLRFSDEFVRLVAEEVLQAADELEARRLALEHCLQKLRKSDRELIRRRYQPGHNGKSVADGLGRPANSVYQSLGRIRRSLLECVSRRIAAEAGT